jgi:hypothetical protein
MSSPALEAFLAALYADEAALACFLDQPDSTLAGAGLDAAERLAVAALDRNALVMAARSYRAKRAGRHVRRGWAAWLGRTLHR